MTSEGGSSGSRAAGAARQSEKEKRSGASCGDHPEFQRCAHGLKGNQRPPVSHLPAAGEEEEDTPVTGGLLPPSSLAIKPARKHTEGGSRKWQPHRFPASPVEEIRSRAGKERSERPAFTKKERKTSRRAAEENPAQTEE